jgi:hypothetical protein
MHRGRFYFDGESATGVPAGKERDDVVTIHAAHR